MSMAAPKLEYKPILISLESLHLQNFKGEKDLTLTPQGRPLNIFGDNATGKTTVYDAFLWLLFDKDSTNRKTFNIKTLDKSGEAIHGLEHTVEAVLSVDGRPLALKKTLTEKWTKKRGEAAKQFTGHETNYWIDDVPVKAGEYQQRISQLLDENLFRLITNPAFFNTQLSWQERRKLLLEIAGDVTDEAVIASSDKLAKLTNILAGKSTDDYKKMLHERIKKLNDEIAKIPIRIDELNSTLAGEEVDYSEIEAELGQYKNQLNELERQLVSASSITEEFRNKQKDLNQLYVDLGQKRSELEQATNAGYNALIGEANRIKRELADLRNDVQTLESREKSAREMYDSNEKMMADLRAEWAQVNARSYKGIDPDTLNCPTCGQSLPADQREEKIAAAKNHFESTKQSQLKDINTQGSNYKNNNAKIKGQLVIWEQDIANKKGAAQDLEPKLEEINAKLNEPRDNASMEALPEYQAIQIKIDTLQAELQKPAEDATLDLILKKQEVSREIERLNKILNNKDVREKTIARIDEHMEQERELAQQIAELEGHKFMLEEFIKAKVNLLEGNINSRFKTITFKLFDTQINEGIKECCEALIKGVPYADANNAAKINAGLDVINTLTRHYGVSAPVFVDNAEAVNELLPVSSQVIRLIVSKDKNLRVEG